MSAEQLICEGNIMGTWWFDKLKVAVLCYVEKLMLWAQAVLKQDMRVPQQFKY